MKIKSLQDLFVQELRDIYHAEKQLVKALPKMAKAATCDHLRAAFEDHLEETKNQVTRIEDVFAEIEEKASAKTCEAMKGLVTEGSEIIDDTDEKARDAGLIAAAQKVEHYEMASYGTLVEWAKELGHQNAANLLQETLDEEKAADEKLNKLALDHCNAEARGEMETAGAEG